MFVCFELSVSLEIQIPASAGFVDKSAVMPRNTLFLLHILA